jgi:hypothetical protein
MARRRVRAGERSRLDERDVFEYGEGIAAGLEHPQQFLTTGIRNVPLRDGPSDGFSEARATVADRRQTAVLFGHRGASFSLKPR